MSKFCPNCGGEARKLFSGEYECLCCGNVFQDAALAQAVTEGSVNATSSVSGADIYEKISTVSSRSVGAHAEFVVPVPAFWCLVTDTASRIRTLLLPKTEDPAVP